MSDHVYRQENVRPVVEAFDRLTPAQHEAVRRAAPSLFFRLALLSEEPRAAAEVRAALHVKRRRWWGRL